MTHLDTAAQVEAWLREAEKLLAQPQLGEQFSGVLQRLATAKRLILLADLEMAKIKFECDIHPARYAVSVEPESELELNRDQPLANRFCYADAARGSRHNLARVSHRRWRWLWRKRIAKVCIYCCEKEWEQP